MGRVIGKAEKNTISVLSSSITYFRKTIETFEKIGRPKSTIKWLKTANTFIRKAIDELIEDLDDEARQSLLKHASKMNLVCRTKDKALIEIEQLRKSEEYVSIENERFLVLCSFAYSSCRTCTKTDHSDCILHKLFVEYDIEPINSDTDKCHFMHSDIKENAYMNLEECIATGQRFRVQPGLTIPGFKRVRSAPLSKEYWEIPKITTNQ